MSAEIRDDGSVTPSNFTSQRMPDARDFKSKNKSLKIGMVVARIYPDQKASPKTSLTNEVIEYDVAVSEADPVRGVNITVFRNCKLSDSFGAPNNYEVYTLVEGQTDGAGGYKNGSVVLLECIDGVSDSGSAAIIGGVSNITAPRHTSKDGEFYDFRFNGVRYYINKDGELEIEFNSVIDVEGKKANEKASGTKIKMDKEGRLKISDNEGQYWEIDRVAQKSTWSNGAESITVDKKNKKIELNSSGDTSSHSDKKTSLDSGDNMSLSSKKDLSAKSEANLSLEATSNMNQKSGGNWEVKATGSVMVKAGGPVSIEGGASAQLKGTITMLGAGSVPVAAVGISIAQGIGNAGAPVISTILTGSATVLVGT